MEDALAVANYFVKKSFDEGIPVTPMKLVKLVYISHGWYLGLSDEPLLSERVEAWKYGPVVPSVYNAFRRYGGGEITQAAAVTPFSGQPVYPMVTNPDTDTFLNKIWDVYKNLDGLALSAMTHQENTPWDKAWNHQGGKNEKSKVIANDDIQEHYKRLAAVNLAKADAAHSA